MKRLAFVLGLTLLLIASVAYPWPASAPTATITVGAGQDNVTSDAVVIPVSATQMAVEIPTITSATIGLKVSIDNVTYYDLYGPQNGANPIIWQMAASTGARTVIVSLPIAMFKYVKVFSGAQQAASRTFRLIFW